MAGDVSGNFTIVDFVTITQYSLVFRVIFNVLLIFKLKWYRFSHSLIALKSEGEKNTVIRVTAKDILLLISVTGICRYPYHRVFFSCQFLHFRATNLSENLYHFSLKFSNTLDMTRNTKEYCVIITKSTIVKLTRNIALHLGISVTVTDTI